METEENNDFDFDTRLLEQFSSMATQDRDVLIADFKNLLGSQLNDDGCAFYLDMNNWNLQDAICSYLELHTEPTTYRLPQMSYMSDIDDSPDGDLMPTNTQFSRTLQLRNDGNEAWPAGCRLQCDYGIDMALVERVEIEPLQPGALTQVVIEMKSPTDNGFYKIQWRMQTMSRLTFGDPIVVLIRASDNVDDLTECMQRLAARNAMTLTPLGNMDADETAGSQGDAGTFHAQTFQPDNKPMTYEPTTDFVRSDKTAKDSPADLDTMEMS